MSESSLLDCEFKTKSDESYLFDPAERRRLEKAALSCIFSYFQDIEVPDFFDFEDKRYVDMCVNTTICDAVDHFYNMASSKNIMQSSCEDGKITEDVNFVISMFDLIRSKNIPKEFSAGIFLMHIEMMGVTNFRT